MKYLFVIKYGERTPDQDGLDAIIQTLQKEGVVISVLTDTAKGAIGTMRVLEGQDEFAIHAIKEFVKDLNADSHTGDPAKWGRVLLQDALDSFTWVERTDPGTPPIQRPHPNRDDNPYIFENLELIGGIGAP